MKSSYLSELQSTVNTNVFIMMRYRSNDHFLTIERAIKNALLEYGLVARLAKDSAIVDDIWENITIYMKHCRFGIVIFEDIDEREFNPNISLELGYMYASGKRCLLLKEQRMPLLPTDICGRIYRNFDVLNLKQSIENQISEWCNKDLGIEVPGENHSPRFVIVYDNASEDPEFRSWGRYNTAYNFNGGIQLLKEKQTNLEEKPQSIINLYAKGSESVGINKDFSLLNGQVRFEYKAKQSGAQNPNLLFCMIPMQGMPRDLLEVGAKVMDESANAYSPYRVRYFVPEKHINDNTWHQAYIDFDFRKIDKATHSIFAPRINDGCPRPGSGEIQIRDIEILSVVL